MNGGRCAISEHDEQVRVFDVLRLNEQLDPRLRWIYAVANGGHRHPATAGRLKAEGVKAGVADICLPFPRFAVSETTEQGQRVLSRRLIHHGAYIEMKVKPNKVSLLQAEFIAFLTTFGYTATVAYSADAALDFIEDYAKIKLRGRK